MIGSRKELPEIAWASRGEMGRVNPEERRLRLDRYFDVTVKIAEANVTSVPGGLATATVTVNGERCADAANFHRVYAIERSDAGINLQKKKKIARKKN